MLVDQGLEILSEEVCLDLLSSQEVGRIAVSVAALPAIFPVNYRVVDGDVLFLTGDGIKANAAIEGTVVGFEVDHIDPVHHTGWSVLIVGQARLVGAGEREALGALHLSPWAGGFKSHLVRIHPEFVSGRRIPAPGSNPGIGSPATGFRPRPAGTGPRRPASLPAPPPLPTRSLPS